MKVRIRVRLIGNLGVIDCPWTEVKIDKRAREITLVQPVDVRWDKPSSAKSQQESDVPQS